MYTADWEGFAFQKRIQKEPRTGFVVICVVFLTMCYGTAGAGVQGHEASKGDGGERQVA